jgi:hypothetical protein
MKPSVIVWDLETVPDLGGFAAANDLVGKSDVDVREAIGDKFPKHIYHSIICIGAPRPWPRPVAICRHCRPVRSGLQARMNASPTSVNLQIRKFRPPS